MLFFQCCHHFLNWFLTHFEILGYNFHVFYRHDLLECFCCLKGFYSALYFLFLKIIMFYGIGPQSSFVAHFKWNEVFCIFRMVGWAKIVLQTSWLEGFLLCCFHKMIDKWPHVSEILFSYTRNSFCSHFPVLFYMNRFLGISPPCWA